MSPERRRHALAYFAQLERLTATMLQLQPVAPSVKTTAKWLESRLDEIEPMFLEVADRSTDTVRDEWLNAAERSLAFFVSELRRLEKPGNHPFRKIS
jgi:hypothetical protein